MLLYNMPTTFLTFLSLRSISSFFLLLEKQKKLLKHWTLLVSSGSENPQENEAGISTMDRNQPS